jgi:hypothetical protein
MPDQLDRLLLLLARTAKSPVPKHITHSILDTLEQRILEHPDNRYSTAERMRTQRGYIIDPENLHPHSTHDQLTTHIITKPNGGKRVIDAPNDSDCANGVLHLPVLTTIAETSASHLDHGFRPLDPITTPVAQVTQALSSGHTYVAQLDISDCFTNLPLAPPHSETIPTSTLALLHALHRVWRDMHPGQESRGLPQGHPLSPAYSNVVLNHVIGSARQLCGHSAIIPRYVDDLTITAKHPNDLHNAINHVTAQLNNNGLTINEAKTTTTTWKHGAHIEYLGYRVEHSTTGIILSPRTSAYTSLRNKLASTADPARQQQIITGWLAAYALTNKPGETTRARDFIKNMPALRLHPRNLPAPAWGALIHDMPTAARPSRYLDDLAERVATRTARSRSHA